MVYLTNSLHAKFIKILFKYSNYRFPLKLFSKKSELHFFKIFTIMIINGMGNSECAYLAIIKNETLEIFYTLFNLLLKKIDVNKTTCIISDKHISERVSIKNFPPSASVILCIRHIKEAFYLSTSKKRKVDLKN